MISKIARLKQTWLSFQSFAAIGSEDKGSEDRVSEDVKLSEPLTGYSYKKILNTFIAAGLLTVLAMPAYACKIPKSYYKHVSCTASSRYFLAVRDSGEPVALLGKKGKKVVDLSRYTQVDVNNFSEELLPVQRGGKVGYLNMSGREVVPAIYDVITGDQLTSGWARPVSNNRIIVKKNGNFGIINTNNEVILPFSAKYKTISNYKSSVAKIVKNNETIWVDSRARKTAAPKSSKPSPPQRVESAAIPNVSPPSAGSYEGTSNVSNSNHRSLKSEVWQTARRDGKWGFVNSNDVPMITFSFDDVTPFSEGLAGVRVDENWGFVNPAGELVIPFRFNDSGVIRDDGNTYQGVAPFVFKNGKAWIGNLTNGTKLCIDKQGANVSCDN